MGASVGGIAFHVDKAKPINAANIVKALFGPGYRLFKGDYRAWSRSRQINDVSMQIVNGTCFVYDDNMAQALVFDPSNEVTKIMSAAGNPTLLIAFGYYESGGGFGYAIFEGGQLTRRRAQSDQGLIEQGNPKEFERKWLDAEFHMEKDEVWQMDGLAPLIRDVRVYRRGEQIRNESELTQCFAEEVLEDAFGVCPWNEAMENILYFRRNVSLYERAGEKFRYLLREIRFRLRR